MTQGFGDTMRSLFKAEQPYWACEFTARHLTVAGVNAKRSQVIGKAASALTPEFYEPSLAETNLRNVEAVRALVKETLNLALFKGSEIALVIPDECARISFVTTEAFPKNYDEQATFLRWKLKKTVPFDLDQAQISFRVLGSHQGHTGKTSGQDLVVAMSPRKVIEEYEELMASLDIHGGLVVPSTLATLNLYPVPESDALFVKMGPDCITTSIFQQRRLRFFRRVQGLDLYESVYPTLLYYQDKLGGGAVRQITLCAYQAEMKDQVREMENKLQLQVQRLGPANVEDLYKPAAGAVHLSWANSI